jgi:hypothetical protein
VPVNADGLLGCFLDGEDRLLTGYEEKDGEFTANSCSALCFEKGFTYAGIQNFGQECYCVSSKWRAMKLHYS